MSPSVAPKLFDQENSLSVSPGLIDQNQFRDYTEAWSNLFGGDGIDPTPILKQLFSNGGQGLINYVYLPYGSLLELLSSVGTVSICTRLVLVPVGDSTALSMVLYCVGPNNARTSGYYLAGMRGAPCTVSNNASAVAQSNIDFTPAVSYLQVLNWVDLWQSKTRDDVSTDWFNSVFGNLNGYTYQLGDFWDAMLTTKQSSTAQELWLNFLLHQYVKPGETTTSLLFGLVLSISPRNEAIIDGAAGAALAADAADDTFTFELSEDNYYYDVSKPCPPACG